MPLRLQDSLQSNHANIKKIAPHHSFRAYIKAPKCPVFENIFGRDMYLHNKAGSFNKIDYDTVHHFV